jgi:hypothetical protein
LEFVRKLPKAIRRKGNSGEDCDDLVDDDGDLVVDVKSVPFPPQLQGTPLDCITTVEDQVGYCKNSPSPTVFQGVSISCRCILGFQQNSANICIQTGTVDKGVFIVVLVLLFVLLLSPAVILPLVFLFRRYRRRWVGLRNEVELSQLLLSNAASDIAQLKQAWSIEGTTIVLKQLVGSGAFGEAWEALWDGLPVCVKVLKVGLAFLDMEMSDYEREVEFMQRTRHPNLVRFFGAGQFGPERSNAPFLVMEFAERGALKDFLRCGDVGSPEPAEPLPWPTKMQLLKDVASGMGYIHSLGHLHRDLKSGARK